VDFSETTSWVALRENASNRYNDMDNMPSFSPEMRKI